MPKRRLLITRRGRPVEEHLIDRALLAIGRHRANAIVLDDPNCSRYHAVLMLDGEGSCYIQDVGSKNGTFLAGHRVTRTRLKAGDAFTVGTYEFRYLEEDGDEDSDTSPTIDDEPTHSVSRQDATPAPELQPFIGTSQAARDLLNRVRKVAPTNFNVLITGESGTGKGVIGKLIRDWSMRATGPFVAVNCAAIPSELIESELFGHKKGSFTGATSDRQGKFQAADGGTLFLDEVGDMSLQAQAKILRAIEERQIEQVGNPHPISVNVRLVSATNKDLGVAIEKGSFREDLLHRLSTVELHIPPLRDRPDDIVLLANCILAKLIEEVPAAHNCSFTSEAIDALLAYPWPGNVRQLRNVVSRAVIMREGDAIRAADLGLPPVSARRDVADNRTQPSLDRPVPMGSALEDIEGQHIEATLRRHAWNITHTADALGIARKTLRERMKKLGLSKPNGLPSPT